jgi:hypothetical protein
MAEKATEKSLIAQLPRLDDTNFEFWIQSLNLIVHGLAIQRYLTDEINPEKVPADERRMFFLLANTMLTSMNDKAWRIASGGGQIT